MDLGVLRTPTGASPLTTRASQRSGLQATALALADPLRVIAASHTTDCHAFSGFVIDKPAEGQPLLHVATAVLDVVVHHIPARAILLGGVGADDVRKCPQRDPLLPDPAEQGEQQQQ